MSAKKLWIQIALVLFLTTHPLWRLPLLQTVRFPGPGGAPASGGTGPISKVFSSVAPVGNTNGATTSAVDSTGTTLIVAVIADFSGASAATLSDSKSNSYTCLTRWSGTSSSTVHICYTSSSSPTVGSGHTFTCTGTGSFCSIGAIGFTGQAASPFSAENGTGNGGANPLAPGSVSTASGGVAVTAISAGSGNALFVTPSGYTTGGSLNAGGTNFGIGLAYKLTSGASENPSWSFSQANNNQAAGIASFH